ncbi:TIGR03085 family metal-binding protein [Tsukamurella sp. 8F]|uniref:TIGR03085 family metal-binding protein n=1 Tax=unclassified Tsukamurella TaxID=2633480 RepID=UPI0023B8E60B|nr:MULTISPECIES: TIGR03085 family metal-binding protein [unclassified Tsukamurella]MDF0531446.1 TIGR03085 family metal-binding protein [Tsukamurella sp. 8J]MDF0587491.1 TIGR03085 family metal-binding protein [Tsukamurella sp. 8F]
MKPARIERAALVEAARAAGPDAPTLCGEWTVRELLAHLVLRESRLDAAPGILLKPLAGYTERVQAGIAARSFERLLSEVASGPPRLSPYRFFDEQANLAEYFVHCEDIRRAKSGWSPRHLDPGVEKGLRAALARLARLTLRGAPLRISLTTEHGTVVTAGRGNPVTVIGAPGEITMWAFGRDDALVTFEGRDADIDLLTKVTRSL